MGRPAATSSARSDQGSVFHGIKFGHPAADLSDEGGVRDPRSTRRDMDALQTARPSIVRHTGPPLSPILAAELAIKVDDALEISEQIVSEDIGC